MQPARFLLSLAAGLALATLAAANDDPALQRRLDRLAEEIDAAREAAHVPGCSIAVVIGGEVVLARGFGLADVEAERPADEHTIYPVGSATKAFTATLVGMLVDEGRLGWDDPVTEHLPYFDLAVRSDDEGAACTLRDLLCHSSGFSRMGILWFANDVPREKILRTAAGAEPWDDFRDGFHYCNVGYLAAGEAAGVAAGSTWDELLVERILEPLGMSASSVSTRAVRDDPRLAAGYLWDEDAGELERQELVVLDNIGPAGSINSNVLDMARWLELQLGDGEVDGKRIVSAETIAETRRPQVEIGNGISYGLGWMLRTHDGNAVVEHGGNIDGFSAEVALVPEAGLGYVLLSNLDVAPLQQASLSIVLDAMLEEEAAAGAGAEEVDLADLVGTYVAGFAQFRDEEFAVTERDGTLWIDVPSQRNYELSPPDADGRWPFAITDQIAVSFQRDEAGAVVGLTMHQGGFDFEVPRKGVAVEPDAPADELERYAGSYRLADGDERLEVLVQGGRLTLDDGGQWIAFHAPGPDGHAPLRARPEWGATFQTDAEGNVVSFEFHGRAGDRLFTRVADAPEGDVPALEEVLALRRTEARVAALEAAGGTRTTGTVWMAQSGLRGTIVAYADGSDRFARHMDFGEFGRIDLVSGGGKARRYTSMRGFDELAGDELAHALLEHPGAVEGDWRRWFDSVEVVRNATLDGRAVHVVQLEKEGLPARTYQVDAETGDVRKASLIYTERTIRIPVTITYSDFEERAGIRRPRRVEIANSESGRTVVTIDSVETGLDLGDEVFTLADPDAAPVDRNRPMVPGDDRGSRPSRR